MQIRVRIRVEDAYWQGWWLGALGAGLTSVTIQVTDSIFVGIIVGFAFVTLASIRSARV